MLSPYYEPEQISSSHLTDDLENAITTAGSFIEIYTPTPTCGVTAEVRDKYKKIKYEEKNNGAIKIHRFTMFSEGKNPIQRAIRYILCNIIQYLKGIRSKGIDIVYSASTPPTQGVLCGKVAKKLSHKYGKKVPFIYNLQDVFPDSLVATGLTKRDSLIYKIGRIIENKSYKYADEIIVISEDIKKNIVEKGVPIEKIEVIYNWIDTDTVCPVAFSENKIAPELGITDIKFRVVYAGNLGLAQGVDTLVEAAELLKNETNIEFLIFGSGAAEEELKKKSEHIGNIRFFPLQPIEHVSEVYSLGNCCAVLCKKGIGCTGVPSKTWSIMACGRPLLVSFDKSELCGTVIKAEAGLCSPAGDAEALADNILKYASDAGLCKRFGEKAREYAINCADKKNSIERYMEVMKIAMEDRQ